MKNILLPAVAAALLAMPAAFAKDEDIPVAELPAPVTEAISKAHPGATLVSAERDLKLGGDVQHYEVKIRDGETMRELTVLPDGKIEKTEVDD